MEIRVGYEWFGRSLTRTSLHRPGGLPLESGPISPQSVHSDPQILRAPAPAVFRTRPLFRPASSRVRTL